MSLGLPEGTPILCRACGAGMEVQPDGTVWCRHCGARDRLPPDELGRVLEIKNRLAQAEQRTAQVRGFDATFAGIFEDPKSFLRVMGVYLAFGIFLCAMSAASLVSSFLPNASKLDTATVAEVVVGQAMGPLFIMGFAASLGMALLTGRRHYRKRIRPLLVARPPAVFGAPFACRACGGKLPSARDADVRCTYCGTMNLVPRELHGAQAAALYRESEQAKAQLFAAHGAMTSISSKMRTTLIVCAVASAILAYGVPMATMAALGR